MKLKKSIANAVKMGFMALSSFLESLFLIMSIPSWYINTVHTSTSYINIIIRKKSQDISVGIAIG